MSDLTAETKRSMIFQAITMARLSSWIYGRDGKDGYPKQIPPIENVDALILIGNKETDTQGAAIVTPTKIYFVFRGSESIFTRSGLKDWITNSKVLRKVEYFGIKAHRGFVSAAMSVLADIGAVLDMYPDRLEIEFGGHSLGGNVATGAAVAVVHELRRRRDPRKCALVTLGQPRFSTRRQLNLALRFVPYLRVQNGSDIVPGVPKLGYSHAGTNIYIPNNPRDVKGKASTLDDLAWFDPSGFAKFRDRAFTFFERGTDHKSMDYINSLVRAAV